MNEEIYSRHKKADAESRRIKDTQDRMQKLHRDAVANVSATPEGQIFLNIIMRECGFHEPSIVVNPQTMDVNQNTMLINEALRGFYVKLRRMIPEAHLKEIEFMNLRKKAEEIVLDKIETTGEAEC